MDVDGDGQAEHTDLGKSPAPLRDVVEIHFTSVTLGSCTIILIRKKRRVRCSTVKVILSPRQRVLKEKSFKQVL